MTTMTTTAPMIYRILFILTSLSLLTLSSFCYGLAFPIGVNATIGCNDLSRAPNAVFFGFDPDWSRQRDRHLLFSTGCLAPLMPARDVEEFWGFSCTIQRQLGGTNLTHPAIC